MKRLLIIRSSLSYTANDMYNNQELGLAKALSVKDYDVGVVFAGEREEKRVCDCYTEYYLRIKKLNQTIGFFIHLGRLIRDFMPDVVQVHDFGMFGTFQAVRLCEKYNIPCVLVQGPYDVNRNFFKRLLEKSFNFTFGRYVLSNVRAIGCKTGKAAEYIKRYNKSSKPLITPVGLDESKFSTSCREGNVRQKYGLSETDKVLLYVGTVESKRRRVDMLVNMMMIMPEEYKLVIVGDGPSKKKLEKESGSNVVWTGKIWQKDLPSIYGMADLFVFPSMYEIYGMVMLESMYFGVPVLSTMTAGGAAIIKDGINGYIINSVSSEEWKDKVCDIFANGDLYKKIKKSVSSYIEKNLLWSDACESFVRLYNEAVSQQ